MAAPQLDKRTINDIEAAAKALAALPAYTPDWTGLGRPDDPGWQVVGLFARMMELLIERMNRVPEKNFLEFLDLVGVEPSPGNAAAVPVTFLLSNKAPAGGEVPAATQVATTQTETADAQVFETRGTFFATPAKLLAVTNLVPDAESYSLLPAPDLPPKPEALEPDQTTLTTLSATEAALTPIDHVLYLAQPALFARQEAVDVTLGFQLTGPQTEIFAEGHMVWRIYSPEAKSWIDVPASYVVLGGERVNVTLRALAGAGPVEIGDVEAVWLACHFRSAADSSLEMPTISGITGSFAPSGAADVGSAEVETTIQAAFANTLPLDFSKPVFPFGERPKYGDAVYIGHDLAFAPDVESVALELSLRDYPDPELEAMFEGLTGTAQIGTKLEWQYRARDGQWKPLPIDELTTHTYEHTVTYDPEAPDRIVRDTAGGSDHGALFRSDVSLRFDIPDDIERGKIGEVETYWLRAIALSREPYGKDGFLIVIPGANSEPDELRFIGPTFVPPVIEQARMTYRYRPQSFEMTGVKTLNSFTLIDRAEIPGLLAQGFSPFTRLTDPGTLAEFGSDPALYFGLDRAFGSVFVSLFVHLQEVFDSEQPQLESGEPQVVWEYLAEGMIWKPLDVVDGTANLTSSGTVAFLGPPDSIAADLFPQLAITSTADMPPTWYRARLDQGDYDYPPRLRMALLNTVMADNQATSGEVVVGSGNGMPNQRLALARAPILDAEVWVREPEIPSAEAGIPPESIEVRRPALEGGEQAIWIRWTRQANFLSSEANSRHYTLEATGGTLTFGDGTKGFIPPIAKDNIVVRNLLVGGGEDANRLAQPLAVKELKSSLPFIDKVFNVQGATGGSDPWGLQQTLELGPQLIKNKDRAVTIEDFQLLVRAAFSQIARVRCLATRSPAPGGGLAFTPGAVTLIIVPKGNERTPQPPKALLKRIADDLRTKALGCIAAEIYAIAPEYHPVRVAATLSPLQPEESSLIVRRAAQALEAFLHPLTGGDDGAGWGFGRSVYLSEVFAVLQAVEGVDHVVDASFIDAAPTATSLTIGEHALVASGGHEIGVV